MLQTADRHHHAAREQAADDQGEQEAEAEQSERLQQRPGDRGQRLGERLLHEDDPAGPGRDGIGGQHRVTVETSGDLRQPRARRRRRRCARLRGSGVGESRLHLREMREIGVAQH